MRSRSASRTSSFATAGVSLAGLADHGGDGGALTWRRDGGIQQHFPERRVLLEEIDELGELAVDRAEVLLLLEGDVEERACVSIRRGAIRHGCSRLSRSLRPISQARGDLTTRLKNSRIMCV
jgi:hypothetical protein